MKTTIKSLTALLELIAICFAQPAFSKTPADANSCISASPSPNDTIPLAPPKAPNPPKSEKTKSDNPQKEPKNFYKQGGMTFMYVACSNTLPNIISKAMIEQLSPNFGPITTDINRPNYWGYQYHFRDRWMMGLVYTHGSVSTNEIEYPDYSIFPTKYSKFKYKVDLTGFMGSMDYCWYMKNKSKSSVALYSGISLGIFNINFNTVRTDSSTAYVPEYTKTYPTQGIQATLIGMKRTYRNGLGIQCALGGGTSSIGLSYGLVYSF